MLHLDLFSGIGGFAYAIDQVWENAEHTFCDNDTFCQAVLRKHWPDSPIFGDIRTLTADTYRFGRVHGQPEIQPAERPHEAQRKSIASVEPPFILTGGFPCQPFSSAGQRKGTTDDRHLWPEMFRVIREISPKWVVGENVRGFTNWNGGVVFDQVQSDLEALGYEVLPFILPACAVNAPHRRDRVWIIAHKPVEGLEQSGEVWGQITKRGARRGRLTNNNSDASDTSTRNTQQRNDTAQRSSERPTKERKTDSSGVDSGCSDGGGIKTTRNYGNENNAWNQNWLEVATRLCGMDDGIPRRVDRLKSLGNAIVPQVTIEIFKVIKQMEKI